MVKFVSLINVAAFFFAGWLLWGNGFHWLSWCVVLYILPAVLSGVICKIHASFNHQRVDARELVEASLGWPLITALGLIEMSQGYSDRESTAIKRSGSELVEDRMVRFESNATLIGNFDREVSQEEAWERLTSMFKVGEFRYSLVPGSWPLERVVRGAPLAPGAIYEYRLSLGTLNYLHITEWNPLRCFAYREQGEPNAPLEKSTSMRLQLTVHDRQVVLEVTRTDRRVHTKERDLELRKMGVTEKNMATGFLVRMMTDGIWKDLGLLGASIE